MQLAIGNVFALGCVIAFPDDGGTIAVCLQVAVKTVCGQIQGAVFVPFNRHVARGEGSVLHWLYGLINQEFFPVRPKMCRVR